MKPNRLRKWILTPFLALLSIAHGVRAEGEMVAMSAEEFQRTVYAGHVIVQMDSAPELDASLLVLLELQRRNPAADPVALADLCRTALHSYRTNAPAAIRTSGRRDEVLAVYLDGLRQVPARTNFNHATLALIYSLASGLNAPETLRQSDLLNAGFDRLLNAEEELPQRQALVNAGVQRAAGNTAFREAMERLLMPEVGVSIGARANEIIQASPGLSNNPAMRRLLRNSETNRMGEVRIDLSELKDLFKQEILELEETIVTNIAVDAEISRRQFNYLSYLAGSHADDMQLEADVHQLQAQKIAASHASFAALSKLAEGRGGRFAEDMKIVGDSMASVAKGVGMLATSGGLNMLGGYASLVSAGLGLVGLFDTGPSPDEMILEGIDTVRSMIRDFSEHVDFRSDRVDQTLVEIYTNLNAHLDRIDVRLGQISGDVAEIREDLVVTQNDLHRLERHFYDYLNAGFRRDLILVINGALRYEEIHGRPMDLAAFNQIPDGPENTFYTWAYSNARDPLSSPANFVPADLTDEALMSQLSTRPLESSLNYLNQFLASRLGLPPLSMDIVANPRDWFVGAQAYLQLSLENPLHYRRINVARLDNIIASGGQLENYFQRILFTGTGAGRRVNTNLFEALLDYYADKLETFTSGVRARENAYAATHAMPAYESWRRWDVSVPRQYLSSTRVERLPLNLTRVARIAAGREHAIALLKDGTVIGWGNNDYGQVTVPPDATNVLAIAASHAVSMILRSDGTVRVFGSTAHGVTEVPTDLGNVVAIATSGIHCVVAKADGSVVAWGYNGHGNCDVPPGLTDVVAVAAADEQRDTTSSLALKSDGTIVGWGSLPAPIPTGLDDVIAIAAGDQHYLALKADGRVAAWGWGEQTNVPPTLSNVVAIAAGEYGNLALLADGTLETWGASLLWPGPNVTNVSAIAIGGGEGYAVQNDGPVINLPQTSRTAAVPDLSDAIAIASGEWHNLALRSNGTVVGWGAGSFLSDPYDIYNQGQAMIPAQATNIVEIAAGARHSLALKSDGTVLAWGENRSHQTNTPGIATNVVALGAGGSHNLALRADGTVVGWGKNDLGQATGVRNSVSPNLSTGIVTIAGQTLTNVAMIVAGHDHSLAIRADGTVVGWGDNRSGQVTGVPTGTPPTGAVVVGPAGTNVVAIAAGSVHSMALRGDGTVIAWGRNEDGQTSCPASATNVLAISAGYFHSLALRADGTVIGWGKNDYGQATGRIHGSPGTVFLGDKPLTNILAMSAGGDFSCFLGAASSTGGEKLVIAQRQLPVRVAWQLAEMSEDVLGELSLDLHAFGVDELSGAKALLRAILDLGLPYTMERDDVLHGFLYGSESLGDSEIARDLSLGEIHRLRFEPSASPEFLRHVLPIRFARFAERLRMRLNEAAEGGQPEQPRLVGHTLRLLSLLRDAHIAQMPVPAPALEIKGGNGRVVLMLFGEPYARYTLLQRANLTGPGWESIGITNLVNEGISELPSLDPRHFYRAVLPAP